MVQSLEQILREFGAACYWYGENTGDYDMKDPGFLLEKDTDYPGTIAKLTKLFAEEKNCPEKSS